MVKKFTMTYLFMHVSFRIRITAAIFIFSASVYSQQVIGHFPEMDGGFEGQATGFLTDVGNVNTPYDFWTTQDPNTGEIFSTGGRSGPFYCKYITSGTNIRLHSPTDSIPAGTQMTIQFYYQGDLDGTISGDIRGSISWADSVGPVNGVYINDPTTGFITWTKYTAALTTGLQPPTPQTGVGIVYMRQTGEFNIDDFVVYVGGLDNTAPPNVPNTGTFTVLNDTDIRITWDAPPDVSDVVGYLLLRTIGERTSAETPNVNGIYAVGDTIGSGEVVAIVPETGAESYEFIDPGTATDSVPNEDYHYYAWAVDKAFNYSANTVALPVELASFTASVVGSGVQLNWRTETEVMNYGFEIERAPSISPPKGETSGSWKKIGFLQGHGNSNSPKDYSFTDKDVKAGSYSYRLKQIDNDGQFEYFGPISVDLGNPQEFELGQNYPNPFNPVTTISFNLPEDAVVKLTIFNILGQEVKTLINESKPAGIHSVEFDASSLNSGFYFYKIEAGKYNQVRKMLLVK